MFELSCGHSLRGSLDPGSRIRVAAEEKRNSAAEFGQVFPRGKTSLLARGTLIVPGLSFKAEAQGHW